MSIIFQNLLSLKLYTCDFLAPFLTDTFIEACSYWEFDPTVDVKFLSCVCFTAALCTVTALNRAWVLKLYWNHYIHWSPYLPSSAVSLHSVYVCVWTSRLLSHWLSLWLIQDVSLSVDWISSSPLFMTRWMKCCCSGFLLLWGGTEWICLCVRRVKGREGGAREDKRGRNRYIFTESPCVAGTETGRKEGKGGRKEFRKKRRKKGCNLEELLVCLSNLYWTFNCY